MVRMKQPLKKEYQEFVVTSLACPKFVSVVEKSMSTIHQWQKKIVAETLSLLSLKYRYACFRMYTLSIVASDYSKCHGENVTLIDSGAETVGEVSMLLDYFEISNSPKKWHKICRFYTTGSANFLKRLQKTGSDRPYKPKHIDLGGV